MKELVLALTVVALCSISFAGSPGPKKVNLPQKADAAAAQETVTRAAPNSPFATTTCSYTFTSGVNNSYLKYCVTANGNILQIETPSGHPQSGTTGEGYGICNESPAQNYTDYATSDTGNWNAATVLSSSSSSVKIARTTSDGNWTLTQTITKVPATSSIKIVMALRNNQAVAKVVYLVRYVSVFADSLVNNFHGATLNSAFVSSYYPQGTPPPYYGLQMQIVGTPPFGYWQAFAVAASLGGPNACDFAQYSDGAENPIGQGGLEIAYVGLVPAGGTKTVTLTYRGL